ncbi:MAG TPA: hypothetical protein VFN49_10975 [Candidatus Aquilonibacter sp.]|nr:hypothetical protein [Candidatus Aquilonibacter sp.]
MRRTFVALAALAVLAGVGVRVHAAPDPYQIFARSRAFWLEQRYPRELTYRIAVDITEAGHERIEHYDAIYDAVDNVVHVDPVSDYEREHPVKPKGVNLGLLIPLGKPLPTDDFLGVPHLAPTYSFGMAPFVPAPTPTPFNSMALVNEIRREFHDPNPRKTSPQPSASPGLSEIATVVARNRDYSIALLGTEAIDGHPCYHLALKPMRDPGRFRIREAWIDEATFAPWQLKDASNFVDGPGTTIPWTIRFADIDGAHYISEERADQPVNAQGERYTAASIRFESIVASTRRPPPDLGAPSGELLSEP